MPQRISTSKPVYFPRQKRRGQAFSLIELMLVLLIMALIAGMAIPRFSKLYRQHAHKNQAQMFQMALLRTQQHCVNTALPHRLSFITGAEYARLTNASYPGNTQYYYVIEAFNKGDWRVVWQSDVLQLDKADYQLLTNLLVTNGKQIGENPLGLSRMETHASDQDTSNSATSTNLSYLTRRQWTEVDATQLQIIFDGMGDVLQPSQWLFVRDDSDNNQNVDAYWVRLGLDPEGIRLQRVNSEQLSQWGVSP